MGDFPLSEQETTLQVNNNALYRRIIMPFLLHDEIILSYIVSSKRGVRGILAVTNQRVLFNNGILKMVIPISEVSSVREKRAWFKDFIVITMLSGEVYEFKVKEGSLLEFIYKLKKQIPKEDFIIVTD